MTELTELELDRVHALLFKDEEKLTTTFDGSTTVEVDAEDIENLIETDPETAWEVYEAFYDNQAQDYVYSDKYLGAYSEKADGSFYFVPFD